MEGNEETVAAARVGVGRGTVELMLTRCVVVERSEWGEGSSASVGNSGVFRVCCVLPCLPLLCYALCCIAVCVVSSQLVVPSSRRFSGADSTPSDEEQRERREERERERCAACTLSLTLHTHTHTPPNRRDNMHRSAHITSRHTRNTPHWCA